MSDKTIYLLKLFSEGALKLTPQADFKNTGPKEKIHLVIAFCIFKL